MLKPMVVLADLDIQYLASLELKFAKELCNKADIEIITEIEYLNEYFSIPRTIDVLVIGEELYNSNIQLHNISNIFILTEKMNSAETGLLNVRRIFKYTSTKEIYNEFTYVAQSKLQDIGNQDIETQIITVYSPMGGSGKTTVSLGISACLAQNHKKVLYIDAEHIHNFQNFFSDKTSAPNEMYQGLRDNNERIYVNIKQFIRGEKIDYLPPFYADISSLNIKFSMYANLIKRAKESKDYDFIVVDLDCVFNDDKAELINMSDRVIMMVQQDIYSGYKLEQLLKNINCNDQDKYIFICNRFNSKADNKLLDILNKTNLVVSEYIETIENACALTIEPMSYIQSFQKIAYLLF